MKKIIIIGAGIAGLTCGVYARLNGFETEIYELHNIPGGECTGWDRKGYHFDGCIHWLMGSKKGEGLNEIWRDTGALDDSVKIINHEVFARYEEGGKTVSLYTNADKLEKHLLEISPEDKKEINKLCDAIRKLGSFGMPIDKPMDMMSMGDGLKFAAGNMGKIMKMGPYNKMKIKDLAARFQSPLIQNAIKAAIPGDYTAVALVMTLASMHEGDSGFPKGGSRALAKRMEKRYMDLGGRIYYKSRVEKILVQDGKAVGIRLNDGKEAYADYTVSCADGYATLKYMLEDNYTPELYRNLFENPKKYPAPTCAIVFMGVNAKLGGNYRAVNIKRESPAEFGGVKNELLSILNYGFDDSMAPEGKTVMAGFYDADFDYWNELHQDKEKYEAEKKRLEEDAISNLVGRFPEAKGNIEVTDVVTPMTYVRYCNAWRGAWMSWGNGEEGIPKYFPGLLPTLSNFIMAGMWTLPPGGLPGAGTAGRFAAQRLCIQEGIEFKNS